MHKTTVYLPDDLRDAVRATATARGMSEAALIRHAVAHEVASGTGRPRPGIIDTAPGDGDLADRVDEALAESGFGE